MKKWLIMLVTVAVCFANVPKQAWPIEGQNEKGQGYTFTDATLIAVSGDIRSVLGPGGKNIAVSANGEALAVIYGDATGDPQNAMEIYIAYSLDDGATWTTYGPHSAELRRIYPGVDGSPDFDANPGELYFEWQESTQGYADGDLKCMIEENVPSAPSFSSPVSMTNASGDVMCPWLGTIAANIEDPFWLVTSAWSYLNNGNQAIYFWVSEDGGYSWSDSIRVVDPIDATGCSGHARFGSGDYVHYVFQELKTVGSFDKPYPYYVESTDGGYTWSTPTAMPDVPLINAENCQFWWHELDMEVVNDEIWHIENDINQVFPDSAGFWIFHGTGSPGSWSWDITNMNDYNQEWYIGDMYYYFEPGQYGSVCHDPVSGMIAITCKAFYITYNTVTTDTTHYGTHVGAIYTLDNGATWTVSAPLSTPWTGGNQTNWNGTETAHRLVNDGGDIWAYTVWVEDVTFNTYFERGRLEQYPPGIEEMSGDIVSYNFSVRPNVTTDRCEAVFNMPVGGAVGVRLYDVGGRLLENIYEGTLAQGNQTINVNTADLATGTYFVVLDTEAGSDAQKIIKVH